MKQHVRNLTKHRSMFAVALLATNILYSVGAWAQVDPESKRDTYAEALRATEAEDWQKARELYLQLWSHSQTFDVAFGLGILEFEQGNYAAAAQYAARAIQLIPPKEKEETLRQLQDALKQAKARVATLTIITDPGVTVMIDGKKVDQHSLDSEVYVEPGIHEIEVRKGDKSHVKSLEVAAGDIRGITLDLAPDSAPQDSSDATDPPPGTNTSTPEATGSGTSTPAPADSGMADTNSGDRSMVPVYIGGGVAALGLAGGIAFTLSEKSARDEVEGYEARYPDNACLVGTVTQSECAAAHDALDRAQLRGNLANVSWTIFGVASLATLGYFFFWPNDPANHASAQWQPTVTLGKTGGGIQVVGSF